jgi:hypothetical protein
MPNKQFREDENAAQPAAVDAIAWVNATECRTKYGLSKKEIEMLGEPRLEPRKYYGQRANHPTKLYRLDHVLALVQQLATQPGRAERKARARLAAEKGFATKIRKLGKELPDLKITIEWPTTIEALLDWVWQSLCARFTNPYEPGLNGVVASIRHEGTNYDSLCGIVRGRVGGQDYYGEFRCEADRVIQAELRARYPEWYQQAVEAEAQRDKGLKAVVGGAAVGEIQVLETSLRL